MAASRLTEKYPRKFARQVCRVMCRADHYRPRGILANVKLKCLPKTEEHPTKRRRLGEKLSPLQIALRHVDVQWKDVMKAADATAPRVGPVVLDQGEPVDAVKRLCPEHIGRQVVLCRGTDTCWDQTLRQSQVKLHGEKRFAPVGG